MKTIRILLFALVWLSCAWFGSWEFNPNNSTRLFAAISMVEDGDATIDEFRDLTIDKAIFGPHAYLDKAPGMTLMALPAVALADVATGERARSYVLSLGDPSLARFLRLRLRLATASGPAVLTAIAAVLLFDMAAALTAGSEAGVGAGLFAALTYALGTPIWGWSTTIFGHAAVAALYVIAIWCFWRASLTQGRWPALIGGAALGWAVVVEYQAVLAGSAIAIWAVWRVWPSPRRWLLLGLAAIGGVVALLPLPLYNLFAFGTVFRVGYSGVVGFDGMQQGLFGLTWPRPILLWEILFGERRGLFWVAPVLLVAPLGLATMADERRTRDIAAMAAAVILIVLMVNAAYVYWDGGNSTGPRHAMPAVGLLALCLAPWWAGLKPIGRWAAGGLLAVSIALNLCIASAEIAAPPEFRFPIWSAVIEYRFLRGDLRTWPSEWFGWSTWGGLYLYGVVAVPLLAVLILRARRYCGLPGA
ncbi:hypothetical protein [Sphingomonas sp. Leaf343]|uniref:hypothetical protein n=1 Tax=Sphingomonas sp. Leaf343 TaxID=1736345 RepID=UPI000701D1F5|nr:hypothetical protein [Sphingomonas sp. Leaf343]KQR80475.1 hypothetical protein ASG07_15105 [Sphingomonas sp. Leaf343]